MRHFVDYWRTLTSDPLIIGFVLGVKIEFSDLPDQTDQRFNFPYRSDTDRDDMAALLQKLQDIGVIVSVPAHREQVISPIFLTTNHDGSRRLILNTKQFNKTKIVKRKFKMETLKEVIRHIQPGDWMASLDLVKGYYNVALHPDSQKFFCCEFEGTVFQFKALPMGISSAPRTFTLLMKTLVRTVRTDGDFVFAYLDDTLVIAATAAACNTLVNKFGTILEKAGFFVHAEKSVLTPTQDIKFLGFRIDTVSMTLRLPSEKIAKVRKTARHMRRLLDDQTPVTVKKVASFVGFAISCTPANEFGLAHFRSFERTIEWHLQRNGRQYDQYMTLHESVRPDLTWWIENAGWHIALREPQISHHIYTDASMEGYGVKCGSEQFGSVWHPDEQGHIGELELRTVWLALQQIQRPLHHANIKLSIDNKVAMSYVNRKGGRVVALDQLAVNIWNFLEDKEARMTAYFVPSKDNPADPLSRQMSKSLARDFDTEWQLDPAVFRLICSKFNFTPEIDLFATIDNAQLPRFAAWNYEPEAEFVDAFAVSWENLNVYIFPPFGLISRILQKVRLDSCACLLIHPEWPSQPWWPTLLQMRHDHLQLPPRPDLLLLPGYPLLRHRIWNLQMQASLCLGR